MTDHDALRAKYFELMMEAASKDLTADQRKASATIVRTKADGTKEYKFPIPDVKHARLAMSMLDQSDLSKGEMDKVRAKATSMLEAQKGYHKMPDGKMMKGDKHEDTKEGDWDKPWTKEDESKMSADEKKKKMMEYGKKKEMMKEGGPMVPAGDALVPKKGGPKAKKDLMKEGHGMKKDWEGAGDTGETGDPKKKPSKSKGSWLAKGDQPSGY